MASLFETSLFGTIGQIQRDPTHHPLSREITAFQILNYSHSDGINEFNETLQQLPYEDLSSPVDIDGQCILQCIRGKGPPIWRYYPVNCAFLDAKYIIAPAFTLINNRRMPVVYVTDNFNCATFCSYVLSSYKNDDLLNLVSHPLGIYYPDMLMLRELNRKFVVDHEYDCLVGAKTIVQPFQPDLFEEPTTGDTDDNIYEAFKNIIQTNINYTPDNLNLNQIKLKGHAIGDIILDANIPIFAQRRKDVDSVSVLNGVLRHGTNFLVGVMPKNGTVTSDGRVRSIFPMHVGYEIVLRTIFGNSTYCATYPHIPSVWHMDADRYVEYDTYDIKKCDFTMWPYLQRLAKEIPFFKILTPRVVYKGHILHPKQMPSGVYCTALLTNWFACALLKAYAIEDAHVFGDAVLTRERLPSKFFRKEDGATINGFRLQFNGHHTYMRADRILLGRGKNRNPCPKSRYAILYNCYKHLNADMAQYAREDIDVYHDGIHYLNWDRQQLGQYCNQNNVPLEVNLFDGTDNCANTSSWDHMNVISVFCERPICVNRDEFPSYDA